MKDIALSHRQFKEHGRIDKKVDSYNGLNQLSSDKQKKMAEIRLRAERVEKRIAKEGIG